MRRGLSLMELVVAVGLVALVVPLVLSLLPSGILTERKATSLEASTLLALTWLEEARKTPPAPPDSFTRRWTDRDQLLRLGGAEFRATRLNSVVSDDLLDVVITLDPTGRGENVVMSTRILRSGT
ncbi:MAG: hypothetical protein AB1758_25095 [Candidatus Eremiobacterota bacterium]